MTALIRQPHPAPAPHMPPSRILSAQDFEPAPIGPLIAANDGRAHGQPSLLVRRRKRRSRQMMRS